MTPMKYVKPQIDDFKSILGPNFVERILNGAQPSAYYDERNDIQYRADGVSSEFIRVLRAKLRGGNSFSIGIAFEYKGKTLLESSVRLSIKIEGSAPDLDTYIAGDVMSVSAFRDNLVKATGSLASLGPHRRYSDVVGIVSEVFCPHGLGELKDLNLSSQPFQKELSPCICDSGPFP